MAKNFVQAGDTLTMVAPADVVSGQALLVGDMFGVAQHDALSGTAVEMMLVGVWTLPKAAVAIAAGAKCYWDGAAGNVTTTAASNKLIGAAAAAAADIAPTVAVRLNGVSVPA